VKLGVITDGISRDFTHALEVAVEFGLRHAELQYIGDKEIGDLDAAEMQAVRSELTARDLSVPCISRHNFVGLGVTETGPTDPAFIRQLDAFKRSIAAAHALDCPLVRIMGFRKEMILFGSGGAEAWNVATGAWDALLDLTRPAVEIAAAAGVTLVIETGNGGMVNSAHLAARFVAEIDSPHLRVLWDPANCLYSGEVAFPDGYDALSGCLGHVHIKDTSVWPPRATIEQMQYGQGHLAPHLAGIAAALRDDGYDGVVSFESVHRPAGGSFEDGCRASIAGFLRDFGDPAWP
jgi:sugar phosphate isomerase/epimerase